MSQNAAVGSRFVVRGSRLDHLLRTILDLHVVTRLVNSINIHNMCRYNREPRTANREPRTANGDF